MNISMRNWFLTSGIFLSMTILVSLNVPGISGIELIRQLGPQSKCICILVVTGHDIDIYKEEAEKAGADEILSKENFPMIVDVIRNRCSAP